MVEFGTALGTLPAIFETVVADPLSPTATVAPIYVGGHSNNPPLSITVPHFWQVR